MKTSRHKRFGALGIGILALSSAFLLKRWWSKSQFQFENKVVVISGGSRGLGLVLARKLVKEGARVALLARNQEELNEAKKELLSHCKTPSQQGQILTICCDIKDNDAVKDSVTQIINHFGRVDILINNAGIIQVGPLETMGVEDFSEALNVNFWGPLHLIWQFIPHLRQRPNARIVNITSVAGVVSVPHLIPYIAAKHALVGLSKGLGIELAKSGIKVTTIVPGLMRTGSHINASFKGKHDNEFAWFAGSSDMRVLSVSAESAADEILDACRTGQAYKRIGWSTKLIEVLHTLFPNAFAFVLSLVNRSLLPSIKSKGVWDKNPLSKECISKSGWQSRAKLPQGSKWTHLIDKAAAENHNLLEFQKHFEKRAGYKGNFDQ